ncbi:MAG: hypothetical protein Kow0069_34210 [Promethearchaeota archaeon]
MNEGKGPPVGGGGGDDPDAWFELGKYHSKQDNHRNAIRCYQKAVALDPTHHRAWTNLAAEYFRSKKYEEAVQACRRAIAAKADDAVAWMTLGAAYFQLNDDGRALFCFERAAELGNEKAVRFLEKAGKVKDPLLRARPVDVEEEWSVARAGASRAGVDWKPRGEGEVNARRVVSVTCPNCGRENSFPPDMVDAFPELYCEACGEVLSEQHKNKNRPDVI